jgi:hypothetical protein
VDSRTYEIIVTNTTTSFLLVNSINGTETFSLHVQTLVSEEDGFGTLKFTVTFSSSKMAENTHSGFA